MEPDFPHRDPSEVRRSAGASYNKLRFRDAARGEKIRRMMEDARAREIPICADETLSFVCNMARASKPSEILELGTATGCSAAALWDACPEAHIVTVERDERFAAEARENLEKIGSSVEVICGEAAQIIEALPESSCDLIFLDCAKSSYKKFLPRLKKILKSGGTLLCDDVLIFGWLSGESEVPQKRRALARNIEDFVKDLTGDEELFTAILDIGDGLAMSVKK